MEHGHQHPQSQTREGTQTAKDPICGMTVVVKPGGRRAQFKGHTFHFCSDRCQTKFQTDPWFYA